MNWKSTAMLTGATALAGWLARPPLMTPPASSSPPASPQAGTPASDVDIQRSAARLHARGREPAPYQPPTRNAFTFAAPHRPAARPAATPAPASPAAGAAGAAGPTLRLSAIAADTVDGVVRRTAVIDTAAGLVFANIGDLVAGFRVTGIDDQGVDLTSTADGSARRLLLSPSATP